MNVLSTFSSTFGHGVGELSSLWLLFLAVNHSKAGNELGLGVGIGLGIRSGIVLGVRLGLGLV